MKTIWFRQGDQVMVRTAVNLSERTRERVLVISIAGRPDLTFPLHAASNPRIMHDVRAVAAARSGRPWRSGF